MKTMIDQAYILTMNAKMDVFEDGYLIFEDDTIIEVGQIPPANFEGRIIHGKHRLLLPGFVNGHSHLGMIPFRSLGDDCPDRLRRFLFPLENACMTSELVVASTKYAMAEMLLGGVTCVADMYYFEDAVYKAASEMGMRALLGETIIDFATCDTTRPFGGLEIAQKMAAYPAHPLLRVMIAPHATNTNSKEVLQQVDALSQAYQIPWMMHVSEMDYEMQAFKENYAMTPVEYLDHIGVLSSRLIMVHGIHLTPHDIELMKQHDVSLIHCIGANTKAGKGVAPLDQLLAAGVRVGLGTDGPSSGNTLDLFVQMRLIPSFQKTWLHDRSIFPASQVVRLATYGGAEALGLAQQIGSLEAGKKADFILMDMDGVNMFPVHDPYAVLVYSANASNVQEVYVNGNLLVHEHRLVHQDLAQLRQDLASQMTTFSAEAKKRSASLNEEKNIV